MVLVLRMKIKEVNPDVVVCENDSWCDYAQKLLVGVDVPITRYAVEDTPDSFLRYDRAVWMGDSKPPSQARYNFVFSYTGGEKCFLQDRQ